METTPKKKPIEKKTVNKKSPTKKKTTTKKTTAKKKTPAKQTATTVDLSIVSVPLQNKSWLGADNRMWRDLAVDSRSEVGLFWIRERLDDNAYYLIVATIEAHVLKKQITKTEAKQLYSVMHDRLPYGVAFPGPKQKPSETQTIDLEKLIEN